MPGPCVKLCLGAYLDGSSLDAHLLDLSMESRGWAKRWRVDMLA